jgi:hypothetical protein
MVSEVVFRRHHTHNLGLERGKNRIWQKNCRFPVWKFRYWYSTAAPITLVIFAHYDQYGMQPWAAIPVGCRDAHLKYFASQGEEGRVGEGKSKVHPPKREQKSPPIDS